MSREARRWNEDSHGLARGWHVGARMAFWRTDGVLACGWHVGVRMTC